MEPIELSDGNLQLGPPRGWSEERCRTVSAYGGIDGGGTPFVVTAWLPNEDDRRAVAEGRPVFLKFVGLIGDQGQPTMMPAWLYTTDEKGTINV